MSSNNELCSKILLLIGGIILTFVGFMAISPLIRRYTNRMYKKSLKKEKIDFEKMGPEIVKNSTEEEQK